MAGKELDWFHVRARECRIVRIAQLGTFDVANYGDLLFPLLL